MVQDLDLSKINLLLCQRQGSTARTLGGLSLHLHLVEQSLGESLWYKLRRKGTTIGQLLISYTFTHLDGPKLVSQPKLQPVGKLYVKCLRASGLKIPKTSRHQNPFIRVTASPRLSRRSTAETKPTLDGGANPIWDQIICVEILKYSPKTLPLVHIEVLNSLKKTSEQIGLTSVSLETLFHTPEVVYDRSLQIVSDNDGTVSGMVHVALQFLPRSSEDDGVEPFDASDATYRGPLSGTVTFLVDQARNLADVTLTGGQSTSVRCTLKPGRQEVSTAFRTAGICDPTWNETITLKTEDAELQMVEISALTSTGKLIGCTVVPLIAFMSNTAKGWSLLL